MYLTLSLLHLLNKHFKHIHTGVPFPTMTRTHSTDGHHMRASNKHTHTHTSMLTFACPRSCFWLLRPCPAAAGAVDVAVAHHHKCIIPKPLGSAKAVGGQRAASLLLPLLLLLLRLLLPLLLRLGSPFSCGRAIAFCSKDEQQLGKLWAPVRLRAPG